MGLEGSDHQRSWLMSASCVLCSPRTLSIREGPSSQISSRRSLAGGDLSFWHARISSRSPSLVPGAVCRSEHNDSCNEFTRSQGAEEIHAAPFKRGAYTLPVDTPVPPHSLAGINHGSCFCLFGNRNG